MGVCITEHEPDGGEEIALAGSIAADDNIELRREGIDNCLVLVAGDIISIKLMTVMEGHIPFEALDGNLLDIHLAHTKRLRAATQIDT